ncbi:MAG: heavy-metal-associated domain-containing protein [Bacilli bacterium]|nr:heavy-metal-associated domain-containing protein [Bacilli bacterium]
MSKKQIVKVGGMMCDGCVRMVQKTLSNLPGVQKVDVSLKKKEAVLKVDEPIPAETIQKALEEAGYHFGGVEE